jgi:uncharacterized protein with gpF-like domain
VHTSEEAAIKAAKRYLETVFFDDFLTNTLSKLFKSFVLVYANATYKRLVQESRKRVKAEGTGAFGFNPEWNLAIANYLNQYLLTRAIIPVTETTKKIVLKILVKGQSEGWGVDRIIQELKNTENKELTDFRARRIVRTELVIASNFADKLVQEKVPFEVEKTWISVHDDRTRDSHEQMDGIVVDGDADFQVPVIKKGVQVGIDQMNGPGDPRGSAGNIINCRCTKALIPKRDKNNKLIPKIKKQQYEHKNT